MNVDWDKGTEEKFRQMIDKVPEFMRGIAEDTVTKKAIEIVTKDSRKEIQEKDMVDAFFAATPFGFHGPMKTDMDSLGIDYKQYGYDK